jgi:hypothetical protein
MNTAPKWILGISAAAGAIFLYQTVRTGKAIDIALQDVKLNFKNIEVPNVLAVLAGYLRITNPTPFPADFKLPYVRVLAGGVAIAKSIPTSKTEQVASNGDVIAGPIEIPFTLSELMDLTAAITSNKTIELELSEMRHNGILLPTKRLLIQLDATGAITAQEVAVAKAKAVGLPPQQGSPLIAPTVERPEVKVYKSGNAPAVELPPVLTVQPTEPAQPVYDFSDLSKLLPRRPEYTRTGYPPGGLPVERAAVEQPVYVTQPAQGYSSSGRGPAYSILEERNQEGYGRPISLERLFETQMLEGAQPDNPFRRAI